MGSAGDEDVVEATDNPWRDVVALAAKVETGHVTQFSPDGFAETHGPLWYYVSLGDHVLTYDGSWVWQHRRETLEERLAYAHRTEEEALGALSRHVSPSKSAYAGLRKIVTKGTGHGKR